jgi:nucleoside-diphosphate-sugar epimerase
VPWCQNSGVRVLVAGATGVLGARVVGRLVEAGHDVVGTTRRADRVGALEDAGASGVIMDAFDRPSVVRAMRCAAPDAVIHELTDLAAFDFAGNARLRIEGTTNLVDAALDAGITRMVAQSISWAYRPGDTPASEQEALAADPETGAPMFLSINALEAAVLGLSEGVILRYGLLYGPGTWYAADGPVAADARGGTIMATTRKTSFVHIDDAAEATIAALTWPAGAVNIVDDDPTDVHEWGPLYIETAGGTVVSIGARTEGRAADNSRARTLGWRPAHPTWRASLLDLSPSGPGDRSSPRPG